MSDVKTINALNVRIWYVEGGVHPTKAPEFLALGKFSTDPSQSVGEDTRVSAPDPNSFNRDIQVGTVPGEVARATFSIGARTTAQRSILLDWKNRKCRVDFFALMGRCGNPQDFTQGGEKWIYFPDGRISQHSFENFGAYGRDENNPTNEMVDATSEEYYEFRYERNEQIASSETVREIATVDIYTGNDCENCPDPCDRMLMTMIGASATPGTQPVILYSSDGGETWAQQTISTLFSNESISDGEIVGGDFLIISSTANEIHWTSIEDLYEGTNSWSQVNSGFVAGKNVRAISAADPRHIWIAADSGYIYFASNFKSGVTVQDAGVATTQNLKAIHAMDNENVLAVGESNAVIRTLNGKTWETITGPAVGVTLGSCWMWAEDVWFVGEGAGGTGKLWLTVNSGKSWSQVGLPSSYLRIDKIKFISEAEGYILARDGSQEYILRTITAGNEWTVLPQGKSGTPVDNSYLNDIAVCSRYSNTVLAGGVAPNGTSGIAILAQG